MTTTMGIFPLSTLENDVNVKQNHLTDDKDSP
jgi:hypothetical protein